MRAAIDIGSNSIRLAVSGKVTTSTITQLASGIEKTGILSPSGAAKTIAAIKEYATAAKAQGVRNDDIYVFATEAVRRATDGKEFCSRVKHETGLNITILSGEQEAYLALNGATKPDGAVTVCDLGGGSMELISSADGTTPDYVKSLPLGVVVIKNMFDGDYNKAIETLPRLVADYGKVPDYSLVITGGSMCTIAAAMLGLEIYDKSAVTTSFTAKQLDGFMPMLLSPKLTVFRPIAKKRADTVPYGAIIIQALINHIGASKFYVSDASNLEAILGMSDAALQKFLTA